MRALLDRLTLRQRRRDPGPVHRRGTGGAYAVSKLDGSDIRNRSLIGNEF